MNSLYIDTTKSITFLILQTGNKVINKTISSPKKVSENLLLEIENLLLENKIELKDLDILGCVKGPGSFTGIRVGLATIKAFSTATNKKIVEVNSFEPFEIKNGVALLSCTKTSVYYAIFENDYISKIDTCEIKDMDKIFNFDTNFYLLEIEQIPLNKAYKNISIVSNYFDLLKNALNKKFSTSNFVKTFNLMPFYVQLSQAERNLSVKK